MFDAHNCIVVITVIKYLAYIREKKIITITEEYPTREIVSSGYLRYEKSTVRKFCGERFTIYLVPVLTVLVYFPRAIEHTSVA
tara:strand:- start:223 stop:471 length:249 start_codon:yes stop_codon:yes gene_type:complete